MHIPVIIIERDGEKERSYVKLLEERGLTRGLDFSIVPSLSYAVGLVKSSCLQLLIVGDLGGRRRVEFATVAIMRTMNVLLIAKSLVLTEITGTPYNSILLLTDDVVSVEDRMVGEVVRFIDLISHR